MVLSFAILAHSETIAAGVAYKDAVSCVASVIEQGIVPVVCVGEQDKTNGYSELTTQLQILMRQLDVKAMRNLIIAYEPVWAVNSESNISISPLELHKKILFIRSTLTKYYQLPKPITTPILYGGSVNADNISALYTEGHCDGFLVGRASINPKEFSSLLKRTMLKDISSLPFDTQPLVLVRSSLNAPIVDAAVVDDTRIRASARTLNYLREKGARVVVIGHLSDAQASLQPVSSVLSTYVPHQFLATLDATTVQRQIADLASGEVLLLENLRTVPGEVHNDPTFAQTLKSFGEYFVFDAFDASHRAHASTHGLVQLFKGYAGILFAEEIEALHHIRTPEHPAMCFLGGGKAETKLAVVQQLHDRYDTIVIGGVLLNTLLQQKGYAVGRSVTAPCQVPQLIIDSPKIILPQSVIVRTEQATTVSRPINNIHATDRIVDIDPTSITALQQRIQAARTIVWNGPFGVIEEGHIDASALLARTIADSSAYSVVGGGETIGMLSALALLDRYSVVSTGGGALLYAITDDILVQ